VARYKRVLERRQSLQSRPGEALMAWRYDCRCGKTAYAFDPHPEIRDSRGHSVRRGGRVVYLGGKFCNPCPVCGQHPNDHTCELRDEMFYVSLCPGRR